MTERDHLMRAGRWAQAWKDAAREFRWSRILAVTLMRRAHRQLVEARERIAELERALEAERGQR